MLHEVVTGSRKKCQLCYTWVILFEFLVEFNLKDCSVKKYKPMCTCREILTSKSLFQVKFVFMFTGDHLPRSLEGLFIYEEEGSGVPGSNRKGNDAIVVEQWTVIEVNWWLFSSTISCSYFLRILRIAVPVFDEHFRLLSLSHLGKLKLALSHKNEVRLLPITGQCEGILVFWFDILKCSYEQIKQLNKI